MTMALCALIGAVLPCYGFWKAHTRQQRAVERAQRLLQRF